MSYCLALGRLSLLLSEILTLIVGQRLLAVAGIVAFLLIYQLLTALAGQIWGLSQAVKTAILSIALALVLVTLSAFVGGVTLASRPVRYVAYSVRSQDMHAQATDPYVYCKAVLSAALEKSSE